ncbi:MAG: universal stress protein [Deltaproteobacteria bacterium]|nr:universal stress protein [Deltaproteobacteria bacterium]
MKRFENILLYVGLEDSVDRLIERAGNLVKQNNAKVSILSVAPKLPDSLDEARLSFSIQKLEQIIEDEYQARLSFLKSKYEEEFGIVPTSVLRKGTDYVEVVRQCINDGVDLVMKVRSVKGHSDGTNDIDIRLQRKCPAELWLLREEEKGQYKRILAAVDPFPGDDIGREMNRKILEIASSLAIGDASELHLISVWDGLGRDFIRRRLNEQEFEKWENAGMSSARSAVDKLVDDTGVATVINELHVLSGAPRLVIPKFVNRSQFDLIVLGTVARGGIVGKLIGNTAEEIIHSVNCSLLTIKPGGFVSPIS